MMKADRKLKVLEVIQPTDGGSALHVQQLLMGLDKKEFTVHLAASNSTGYDQVCIKNKTPYHRINFTRSINPLKDIQPWWQLWQLCHKEHFDVIHLHSTKAGLLGRMAALFTSSKVIYTPHSPLYMQLHPPQRQLFLWIERLTMPLVDKVILVSKSERSKVVEDGMTSGRKCEVIVNGVDVPHVKRSASKPPIITMVSRLEKQKRQQDLIMAAPIVLKRFPEAKFNLIGGGSRHYELQSLIQDHGVEDAVNLLGPRDDVQEQFAKSTIAVQCSETEGMPYVVLEAMAQGLPVIGTRVEGIVDLVEDGKTGLLYEKGDYKGLAEQIIFLLTHRELSEKYGMLGRSVVEREYSRSTMINNIQLLYTNSL